MIGIDEKIYEYLNIKKMRFLKRYHISYIVLDDLDIIEKYECDENRYDEYYAKVKIAEMLKNIERRFENVKAI